MRIGELSRRTGISHRALRYYEEQGLLRPLRRPSGYREYCEADVLTVRRIRVLLAAGLNTATIADVLPWLMGEHGEHAAHGPELRAILDEERIRISGEISELGSALAMLDSVIETPLRLQSPERCPVGQPVSGRVLGSLQNPHCHSRDMTGRDMTGRDMTRPDMIALAGP